MSDSQIGITPCPRSKCMFCMDGVVYDNEFNRVIGRHWCDIDAYSSGINCTPDGCYYYERRSK